jgi:hypothetical protein
LTLFGEGATDPNDGARPRDSRFWMDHTMSKTLKILSAAIAAIAGFAALSGSAQATTFLFNYSGQGTSGNGYVIGDAVGGGQYDLTSGVLYSSTLGTETLVPGSGVFQNANGDNFTYDNELFVPANAPASPDGANLTYAGGLVFQTALPSKEDIYFSAAVQGASDPSIFYFAGYDRSYGTLDSFDISAAVPEPATWVMMLFGVGMIGGGLRMRRKTGAVLQTA